MNPYTIRQIDQDGATLSEVQIDAPSTDAALRQLSGIAATTQSIDVYDREGARLRQVHPIYWRQSIQRRR